MKDKRNNNIDIIKGWAMLTIIIFHCSQSLINGDMGQLLGNPWNVPVFFIIGGFFLKEESLLRPFLFLKKKNKKFIHSSHCYLYFKHSSS